MEKIWLYCKDVIIFIIMYIFPSVAIGISIISFIDSRKANKVKNRLNVVEETLKKYALEDKEKEREEANKACIEARIMNISKHNYKIRFWNSGKATAYNIDFNVPDEGEKFIIRDKVPYEFLDPNKSFEEHFIACYETPRKIKIITIWEDKQERSYSKEQIISF
ncbi:MAG: hypothetical protein ACYCYI_00040 [Saccharofermentanales bacterium]